MGGKGTSGGGGRAATPVGAASAGARGAGMAATSASGASVRGAKATDASGGRTKPGGKDCAAIVRAATALERSWIATGTVGASRSGGRANADTAATSSEGGMSGEGVSATEVGREPGRLCAEAAASGTCVCGGRVSADAKLSGGVGAGDTRHDLSVIGGSGGADGRIDGGVSGAIAISDEGTGGFSRGEDSNRPAVRSVGTSSKAAAKRLWSGGDGGGSGLANRAARAGDNLVAAPVRGATTVCRAGARAVSAGRGGGPLARFPGAALAPEPALNQAHGSGPESGLFANGLRGAAAVDARADCDPGFALRRPAAVLALCGRCFFTQTLGRACFEITGPGHEPGLGPQYDRS